MPPMITATTVTRFDRPDATLLKVSPLSRRKPHTSCGRYLIDHSPGPGGVLAGLQLFGERLGHLAPACRGGVALPGQRYGRYPTLERHHAARREGAGCIWHP